MRRPISVATLAVAMLVVPFVSAFAGETGKNAELLKVRRAVWIAWLENDVKTLKELVPPDTIVISTGEPNWKGQKEELQAAADFHAKGGKLIRLEFPRTKVQMFGNVAVTYSQYVLELEVDGKRSTESGRVTEVFVRRNGHWTNPGWHTDSEK
jgi:ketosteroid isomerase-like protein